MFTTESSNLIGLDLTSSSVGRHRIENFTNENNNLRLYESITWNSNNFIMNDDNSYMDMDDDGDDTFNSPLPFDASDGGLWNGRFVPPPPRPPFLDDTIISDGLTTCDLCTWALPEKNAYSIEGSIEAAGDLGFVFMITLVSILSAVIGAILMIAIYRCNRLKSANGGGGQGNGGGIGPLLPWWCPTSDMNPMRNSRNMPKQRPAESLPIAPATPTNGSQQLAMATPYVTPVHVPMLPSPMTVMPHSTSTVLSYTNTNQTSPTATITTPTNPQVWIWLKNVNTPMMANDVITFPQSTSIENYYTNTDDNISSPSKVSEVVYEEISGIG